LTAHPHIAAWIVFFASYLVFAVGRFPGTRIDRPAAAVIGAVMMFVFRVLGPAQAMLSIDYATILLLFAMMVVVAGLHIGGFFERVSSVIYRCVAPRMLLPVVIFTSGILSALLVNDIVCLLMAPLVMQLARRFGQRALPYLLALATASNIGSTATITGNPQNILIGSVSKVGYLDFFAHLGPIALIGLLADWAILHWLYFRRPQPPANVIAANQNIAPHPDGPLWWPVLLTLATVAGFFAGFPPALVAAFAAALLLMHRAFQSPTVFLEVDWSLLVFFIGLFLIVGGAEQAGIASRLLGYALRFNLNNAWIFAAVVAFLSNVVSNVPSVMVLKALVPNFADAHRFWLLLAMSSTLAGNLTITGSVANIIVIEKARTESPVTFLEYLRAGVPVTVVTMIVGVLWLTFV
jgi:Na+/H+ antiporter NhaD/arsenite permease-like protein